MGGSTAGAHAEVMWVGRERLERYSLAGPENQAAVDVEHHMFPMVPYYRLPELHEEIKHDCAPVYPSLWAAYKEIIPAVLRQLRDQEYYVRRELLPGAAPFNEPTPLNDGRALPLPAVTAA